MVKKLLSLMVLMLIGTQLAACATIPAGAVSPTATPEPVALNASTPEESVETFFTVWMDYSTPDANGYFRNPMVDEIYKDSPYLTPELKETMEETLLSMGPGGYDPVMCAQDTPQWIRVEDVQINGEQASAVVVTSMLAGPQQYHRVPVQLELRGENWLISEIDCFAGRETEAVDPELAGRLPDWLTYEDEQYGFHFEYPSSWVFTEATIADETSPVQRVVTFAPKDWNGAMTPVSLEISVGQTGEIPHSETVDVAGLTFYVEQTPFEETFYTVELPEGVRVAVRDSAVMASGGDENLISQWEPVIEGFVYGFRYD